MIRNSFTKAAIIGTVFAAAFAGASFAQDSALSGAWKIEGARFSEGSASLSIERDASVTTQSSGQFIVTHARRSDFCTFRCQYGLPERSLTVRFTSVEGSEQLMGEVVAFNKK
jgi:hypothetical protein